MHSVERSHDGVKLSIITQFNKSGPTANQQTGRSLTVVCRKENIQLLKLFSPCGLDITFGSQQNTPMRSLSLHSLIRMIQFPLKANSQKQNRLAR